MKKKIIIVSILIIALVSLTLYYTLATDITMKETIGEADLTYNIDINDTNGRSISVEANKNKVFDIFITNKNGGTIKYGLAYSPTKPSGVTIAKLNTSLNNTEGTIGNDSTIQVTLAIINNTSNAVTFNIVPVTGFANGGNLVVPTGYSLITDVYTFSK